MTFEQLNIPNGQSALAGLVLYQSWTVTTRKYFRFSSDGFFKKFVFLY